MKISKKQVGILITYAKSVGAKTYFTAIPCSRGHIAARITLSRKCVECNKKDCVEYNRKNKDSIVLRKMRYNIKNKELVLQQQREARKRNRKIILFRNNYRRAQKLQATPSWVDKKTLKEIYENCAEGYEVDHIVPLKGKNVCGLHVPWNLQYLTPEENASKSNKLLT